MQINFDIYPYSLKGVEKNKIKCKTDRFTGQPECLFYSKWPPCTGRKIEK